MESYTAVLLLVGIPVGLTVFILLVQAARGQGRGDTFVERAGDQFKELFRDIIAGSITLLKWGVGLIVLALVGLFLYWLLTPSEWMCRLDDGDVINTDGEPNGEWVETQGGTRIPRDRVEACFEVS